LRPVVTKDEGSVRGSEPVARSQKLGQIVLAAGDFVLQGCGQLVDVAGSNVYRHMVGQQRGSIAAYGIAFCGDMRTRSLNALPRESDSR